MSKRITVTGGAGFVGSHLCLKLLQDGHQVFCIDNLFTGSKKNIKSLMAWDAFEFINHDVCFPYYSLKVDEIYNLLVQPLLFSISTTQFKPQRLRCLVQSTF